MKRILASAALAAFFTANAYAQPPETTPSPQADVTVESDVSAKVLEAPETAAPPPANTPLVLSKTTVEETPEATIEQTSETIIPVSNRPTVDAENPIAPEVQAVVSTKKHYTTADLANAQLAAVLATPASEPTTTITTTRTTPKSDS